MPEITEFNSDLLSMKEEVKNLKKAVLILHRYREMTRDSVQVASEASQKSMESSRSLQFLVEDMTSVDFSGRFIRLDQAIENLEREFKNLIFRINTFEQALKDMLRNRNEQLLASVNEEIDAKIQTIENKFDTKFKILQSYLERDTRINRAFLGFLLVFAASNLLFLIFVRLGVL